MKILLAILSLLVISLVGALIIYPTERKTKRQVDTEMILFSGAIAFTILVTYILITQ